MRDNIPAWTTHARKVLPGQSIRVNRDDDPEEGDIGVKRREMSEDAIAAREKLSNSSTEESSGSSSSQVVNEKIEMRERRRRGDNPTEGEEAHGATAEEREMDDEEHVGGGRRTPPLNEYREGSDLVRERKGPGGEVRRV